MFYNETYQIIAHYQDMERNQKLIDSETVKEGKRERTKIISGYNLEKRNM